MAEESPLQPREHARATAKEAALIGLPHKPHGLLLCEDPQGNRTTVATADLAYFDMLVKASATTPDPLANLLIPPGTFPLRRPGWPDEWRRPTGPWSES